MLLLFIGFEGFVLIFFGWAAGEPSTPALSFLVGSYGTVSVIFSTCFGLLCAELSPEQRATYLSSLPGGSVEARFTLQDGWLRAEELDVAPAPSGWIFGFGVSLKDGKPYLEAYEPGPYPSTEPRVSD